jgi:hypothetical protein
MFEGVVSMASITFEGPDPTDLTARSTVVVTMADEALLAVVQAFCELEGYNPDADGGPGLFTIRKTVAFWTQKAEYHGEMKDKNAANAISRKQMGPLRDSIKIETGE